MVRRIPGDLLIGLALLLAVYLTAVMLYRTRTMVLADVYRKVYGYEMILALALLLAGLDVRFGLLGRLPALAAWPIRLALAAFLLAMGLMLLAVLSHAADVPDAPADTAVVLGMALEDGKPGRDLMNRVAAAARYADENPGATLVVTGGNGGAGTRSEGEVMRDLLAEAGVDPARVRVEDRSRDTVENFRNTRALVDPEKPVVIVTSGYHVMRALALARAAGFREPKALAAASDPLWFVANAVNELVPTAQAVLNGTMAFPMPFR